MESAPNVLLSESLSRLEIEEVRQDSIEIVQKQSGHSFYISTFITPTYCNVCTDFIWGIRKQGIKCDCECFTNFLHRII